MHLCHQPDHEGAGWFRIFTSRVGLRGKLFSDADPADTPRNMPTVPRTWVGVGFGLFAGGLLASLSWARPLGLIVGIPLMVAGGAIMARYWGRPEDDDFRPEG